MNLFQLIVFFALALLLTTVEASFLNTRLYRKSYVKSDL